MIARRTLLGGALGAAAVKAVRAQDMPVSLVVGAPPGSAVDQGARSFIPFLERHMPGVRVTVANRPGNIGLAALGEVAASAPDGRTIGWVSSPALSARSIDTHDGERLLGMLSLVGAVQKEPIAVVSPADGPLASVQELIARSSENAEAIPLGTPPSGSAPYLAALRLQSVSGTKLNIVAFPSAAAARQAALAGNVVAALLALGDAIDFLRAGRLVGLGLAARQRVAAFPDLTPLHESGLALSAVIQRGIAAPAGLPPDMVAMLGTALQDVAGDPEFVAQGEHVGFSPVWLPAAAWSAQIASDRAALARLWNADPWLAISSG